MSKIPKKLHYCWFGNGGYSPLMKDCMRSWDKYLPDFEKVLWHEQNSPMQHTMIKRAMEAKKYAFVADYVRMYALYEYGGVYLDTDMEIIKNIEPLLCGNGFLGYEHYSPKNKLVSAGIICLPPKSNLAKEVLQIFDKRMLKNKSFTKPLPEIITQAINILEKRNALEDIKLYMPEYFYPYNPYDMSKGRKQLMYADIQDNTYAIHHWNGSWIEEPSPWKVLRKHIKRKIGIK